MLKLDNIRVAYGPIEVLKGVSIFPLMKKGLSIQKILCQNLNLTPGLWWSIMVQMSLELSSR